MASRATQKGPALRPGSLALGSIRGGPGYRLIRGVSSGPGRRERQIPLPFTITLPQIRSLSR